MRYLTLIAGLLVLGLLLPSWAHASNASPGRVRTGLLQRAASGESPDKHPSSLSAVDYFRACEEDSNYCALYLMGVRDNMYALPSASKQCLDDKLEAAVVALLREEAALRESGQIQRVGAHYVVSQALIGVCGVPE